MEKNVKKKKAKKESARSPAPRDGGRPSKRKSNPLGRLRRVRPGASYLITRKICSDLFLLRPSEKLNQALLYGLILKANKYGILLHDFCFMSNHLHLEATDPRGALPDFMREFLGDASKVIKIVLGTSHEVWSGKRYSAVDLLDLDSAERKSAYIRMNPMRAGLTEPESWPGLTSAGYRYGERISVEHPGIYFSTRYSPEQVELRLTPPTDVFTTVSEPPENQGDRDREAESIARIESLVDEETRAIRRALAEELERQKMKRKARRKKKRSRPTKKRNRNQTKAKKPRPIGKLLGVERVLSASPYRRGNFPVQSMSPRFATTNGELLTKAIQELRKFQEEHEWAKQRYREGHTRVRFPEGTYGYRKLLGVRVKGAKVAA